MFFILLGINPHTQWHPLVIQDYRFTLEYRKGYIEDQQISMQQVSTQRMLSKRKTRSDTAWY